MAGFDIKIPTIPDEREIAKCALKYAQLISRKYEIVVSYRWKQRNTISGAHYYVTIDGSLPSIESWANQLVASIHHFVEGYRRSKNLKTKIGIVLPICVYKGLHEFREELQKVVDYFPQIENKGFINSFNFNTEHLDSLSDNVKNLSQHYHQYVNGFSSPEIIIEHIHSILEALLKKYYGEKSKETKLFQIIKNAKHDKIITNEEFEILEKLRKMRNKTKHETFNTSDDAISEIFWPTNTIIQKIIYHIESKKMHNKAN